MEAGERLKNGQGVQDCISAHTLIEVGETQEALDFCKSILRTPTKTIEGLQTRAYLTVLSLCLDEKADKEIHFQKARSLWHRIKSMHDNAYGISAEEREISMQKTEKNWKVVMESLDETEAQFKEELQAVKSALEEKVSVLEHELLLSKSRATLLEDSTIVKQNTIDALVAEVALLKRQSGSSYSQSSSLDKPAPQPGSSKYTYPWPLSLCMGSGFDEDEDEALSNTKRTKRPGDSDESKKADEAMDSEFHKLNHKNRRHVATQSILLDTNMYSTTSETMRVPPSTATSTSEDFASTPADSHLSDIDKLMKNGPILVRPGKPLAYVDDTGNIVEVQVEMDELPPMMFPPKLTRSTASKASLSGKHRSTMF